ncbi:hypothetical protein NC651_024130 [Populus alba x Populus x berolinensis]|nr:hypothetical protein NC651_024130 [Populus alba x Populus x berolinensis]
MAQHPFKSEGYQGNTPLHCLAASLCEDTTLLKNSRVDKMAIKEENLNVQDIVGANDSRDYSTGPVLDQVCKRLSTWMDMLRRKRKPSTPTSIIAMEKK